jgi:hypothetical protein
MDPRRDACGRQARIGTCLALAAACTPPSPRSTAVSFARHSRLSPRWRPPRSPTATSCSGSFQGTAGINGIYFAHPRDTTAPVIPVTGLPPALAYSTSGARGVASLLYHPNGSIVAGERSPLGTSVDVHVLQLNGAHVVTAQLFSVGTSVRAGEIPQMGFLPDGRIVVSATDLAAGGPLAQFLTQGYNHEGIGILDPVSGGVVPIAIPNLNQFPGVINGLAVSRDGSTIYVGNYISVSSGDLWAVPVAGGNATMVATLPFGASNVAIDHDGTVLVTTLNGPPNLFRYDPVAQALTVVPTASGPLNAVAVEPATGNYVLATANAGVPSRSLLWMEPTGPENLLQSPGVATIAAVDMNPNPESYGAGTPGAFSYSWKTAPNGGGLPLVGNPLFSVTVQSAQPALVPGLVVTSLLATPPQNWFGLNVLVDLGVSDTTFFSLAGEATLPLPLPNDPGFVGMQLFCQAFVLEHAALAASPGLSLTIL